MSRPPKTKVDTDLGLIPEKNTPYWYVRSCGQTHKFIVCETQFYGGLGDMFRLTNGNVYFSKQEAVAVMLRLNERLDKLNRAVDSKKAEEERKREQERVKAELALKKRKPPMTVPEKAKAYERKKKKRIHPDITD